MHTVHAWSTLVAFEWEKTNSDQMIDNDLYRRLTSNE